MDRLAGRFPGNTIVRSAAEYCGMVRFCQRRDASARKPSRVSRYSIANGGCIGRGSHWHVDWDIKEDRFYGDASFAKIFDVDLSTVSGGKISEILRQSMLTTSRE